MIVIHFWKGDDVRKQNIQVALKNTVSTAYKNRVNWGY